MEPIYPMEPVRCVEIPKGDDWAAQIKWDGVRVLTYFDGNEVRLFNRKCRERTHHYPELLDVRRHYDATSIVLDGEVIALGTDGKPSFHEVMRRDGIRRMDRVVQMKRMIPVSYMVFDILYYNGEWVTEWPFVKRMELLSRVLHASDTIQRVVVQQDAPTLFEVMKLHGMEGIVMKQTASPYRIHEKRDTWVKVKNYSDLVAVIGGFTRNDAGVVNALLLGLYDEHGAFWYIGHSGTGRLTQREWRELTTQLIPFVVENRPFVNRPERHKDAVWVSPTLTVKIQYVEWTEGKSLRQPTIQAFVDIPPQSCLLVDEFHR